MEKPSLQGYVCVVVVGERGRVEGMKAQSPEKVFSRNANYVIEYKGEWGIIFNWSIWKRHSY